MGVVKAEGARLQFAQADTTVDTREVFGEQHLIFTGHIDEDDTPCHSQSSLDRVGDAADVCTVPGHQTVDHDLDRVPFLLVEIELLAEIVDFAVHSHSDESSLARVLEDLFVLALASPDHRRENLQPGPFWQT